MALSRHVTTLLVLLLATDGLFVVLHGLRAVIPEMGDPRFSIARDAGFAEVFQYVKEYWVILLLVFAAVRRRSLLFLVWAVLFGYLLGDDVLMIHERLGGVVSDRLDLPPVLGLRPKDLGEVAVTMGVASMLLAAVAAAHARANSDARRDSRRLLGMVAALAVFGVLIDLLHEMMPLGRMRSGVTVVEDGGEMVVMSLITAFVFMRAGAAWGEPAASRRGAVDGGAVGDVRSDAPARSLAAPTAGAGAPAPGCGRARHRPARDWPTGGTRCSRTSPPPAS